MFSQDFIEEVSIALVQEEIELYLQPKYEILTGHFSGAEVLARWHHPKKGILAPCKFISRLEEYEYIYYFDQYIFKKTCELLSSWKENGGAVYPLSINVSSLSLTQSWEIDEMSKWIESYQIPIEWIEIEVTESALAKEDKLLIQRVKRLKESGFRISMDDFGKGYSSLCRLKELDVDVIKLDRLFLKNIIKCQKSRHIVTSIVELGKKLNLLIVAEGIEEKEQLEFLKSIKCDIGQGFLFSEPIPVTVFEKKFCKKIE